MDVAYTTGNPEDSMDIEIYYSLTKCTTCREISLFVNTEYDDDRGDLKEAILCYPHENKVAKEIPEIIAKNYAEAKKVMKISRPAFAIMIRRGLEFMCQDQQAKGKTLKAKLDNLVSSGIIPSILAEMGDTLRSLGNIGAHAADYKTDREEVEAMNDFFISMIEYVYVAPFKLSKLKESIKKKISSDNKG
jgi:hypothetical protein